MTLELPLQRVAGYSEHFLENLSSLCKGGRLNEAVQLIEILNQKGTPVSREIFYWLLQGCLKTKNLVVGRRLHSLRAGSHLASVPVLGDHLIHLFASCGSLQEANQVFSNVSKPSLYTWNAIISAHTKLGESQTALKLYKQMQQECMEPDKMTILCLLKACGTLGAIEQGRLMHNRIVRTDLDSDVVVASTLIDMYAKCGSLVEGQKLFDDMREPNIVSCAALIGGFVQHGHEIVALEMFNRMQQEGMKPSKVIYLSIVKACRSIQDLKLGRLLHEQIVKSGFSLDIMIGTTIVDMYAKGGNIREARRVFDELPDRNVVSWGAMIVGCTQHGHSFAALDLFEKMQRERIKPDNTIFSCILKACSSTGATEQGMMIHDVINRIGLASDIVVGSSLVDMYAKCGCLQEAHKVFESLPKRNVVLWGAMIAGYVQHGFGLSALHCFEKMEHEGIVPDKVMLICILKACTGVGAIVQGRLIHNQVVRSGLQSDVIISTNLVDMYARCGSLGDAQKVFAELLNPDVASCSSMIAAYVQSGNCRLARVCLNNMLQQGLRPDHVMFTSILMACSHVGLLNEGLQYFKSMREDYGITENIEHYNCMVDLLSRAGCLNEAKDFLETMPIPPNITAWISLLTACRTHRNMVLGRWCFDQVLQLDLNDASAHILMSNIYTDACMWEDLGKLNKSRKCAGLVKVPGRAWIEIYNKVHEFIVESKHYSEAEEVFSKIQRLNKLIKDEGSLPQLDVVLKKVSDEDKEDGYT